MALATTSCMCHLGTAPRGHRDSRGEAIPLIFGKSGLEAGKCGPVPYSSEGGREAWHGALEARHAAPEAWHGALEEAWHRALTSRATSTVGGYLNIRGLP